MHNPEKLIRGKKAIIGVTLMYHLYSVCGKIVVSIVSGKISEMLVHSLNYHKGARTYEVQVI